MAQGLINQNVSQADLARQLGVTCQANHVTRQAIQKMPACRGRHAADHTWCKSQIGLRGNTKIITWVAARVRPTPEGP
ncbi:hypothetical protein [Streptomyces olivochromogenes]|uniref:hypothetical protein n=1 Tax=Streptomyces olivochromogenes TaxID=1963 RepID=UPI00131DA1F2|nr:hypothetical protein [Streptomyces olivochromogenes]